MPTLCILWLGKWFNDSCWRLGCISLIFHERCVSFSLLHSKGLAMCRLGGVITTQKMYFYKLKLNCTKHFWVAVRPFYPNWHVKDLTNVTNQFLLSFSVFGSFFITETGQDWGRVLCKLWQGKLKINHMKNPSLGALQNPLPNLERGWQSYQ